MMPSGISSLCVGIILWFQMVVSADIALDFRSACRKPQVYGPLAWVASWSEAYIIHMK